jgi:transcriptional regulator with XRE-family HTH domain
MEENSTSLHTILRYLLRELRLQQNVQQAQISQLLQRTAGTWSKVESGEQELTLDHILTVCHACQVWPSGVFHTAQEYMGLFNSNGWYVATHGPALPKAEDKLVSRAEEFYKFQDKKKKEEKTPVYMTSWALFPVLQTPYPYPGHLAPLDVFRWALDDAWRQYQLSPPPDSSLPYQPKY